jgi:hypothetical protein
MAIAAPITANAAANGNSWLHRILAALTPAPSPVPIARSIEMTIVDLRLLLRRIDHARREHTRWDAGYLGQTISRALVKPLEELDVPEHLQRLCYGAAFALAPIAGIGADRSRHDVDVDAELDEAAALMRAAIANAEAARHRRD